jgi:serine/threonine-protein kinase
VILEVIAGPDAGQRLEYEQHDTLLVGRGSLAKLRLTKDPHFSRNHFLLEVNPPDVLVRDLGSRNGTFVNGRKVQQCRLQPGDVISGGQTQVRFTLLGEQDDIATADLLAPAEPGSAERSTYLPAAPSHPVPSTKTPAERGAGTAPRAALLALPGYDIARKLGQGGMGMVYLARRQATGEMVAIKIVVPESAADDRAVNLFFREVRILSQLHHPNIVEFREMGLHLGQVFFVMEYVETIDWTVLTQGLPLAERVRMACAVFCQVLEGLQHAHQRGFVHRDVKPNNILLARGPEQDLPQAKLADFGLAKSYESAGLSGMTHEGQVLGTVPYMAPEQVVSARAARPAVDIYAAAASLYNLISGKYPYDFPCGCEPLLIVLEAPVVPLRQRCSEVPDGLDEVVSKALARDPPDRFSTADALRQALLPYAGC